MSDDANKDARIAAMKRERAGYRARGDEPRAAMVDAELRNYGVQPDPAPEAAKAPVEDSKPRGRASREQRQATADKPEGTTG